MLKVCYVDEGCVALHTFLFLFSMCLNKNNTKDKTMKKIRKIDVVQQNPRNQKLKVAAYCRVSNFVRNHNGLEKTLECKL